MQASGHLCPACGAELQRSWRPLALAIAGLALALVGYFVLTRVVTIERIKQQVESLPTMSLVELLPQATPTSTPAPTQTSEVRPTPTRIPTLTPFASPTPTAEPTTTETPTLAPTRRLPTATPGYPYPAPSLLAPVDGTEFAGTGTTILLSWRRAEALASDGGYAVTLRYQTNGQARTLEQWVRDASWVVPPELHDKLDPANPKVQWSVRITRGTADGEALSLPSATWSFVWR